MSKIVSSVFATCAAAAITALVALPVSAGAAEGQPAAAKVQTGQNAGVEISSQRRYYRGGYGRRYYRPAYGYGYRPYRPAYGYGYGYGYRPYYRPAPFFRFSNNG